MFWADLLANTLPEYESPVPTLVEAAGKLLVVLAVAIVALVLLKVWLGRGGGVPGFAMNKAVGGGGSGGSLKLIESMRLGPDQTIHLVEVAGRPMLLSATAGRVELLAEVEPVNTGDAEGDGAAVSRREFEEVLRGPATAGPPGRQQGDG